ncbi:MAG: hypothetical protein V1647_00060 [Pseudomonadota bacterium]
MKKILITLLITSSSILFAAEYDYIYKGARPMGMGGAFTAVSDDINALFYNPAGLNRIKKGEGEIIVLNPGIVMNTTAIDIAGKISRMVTQNPMDALTPYIGQNMHLDIMSMMPSLARKNFAVALMLPTIRNNTLLRRNVATEAYETIIADSGLMLGFAHGFLQDRLAVGVDIKFLVRGAGDVTFDAVQLYTRRTVNFNDIGGYGFGVDGDIGAMYTFNKVWFFIPTVGMSINNIGATKFPTHFGRGTYYGALADEYRLKRSLSIGSKFELPSGAYFSKWIFVFDINNIGFPGSMFKKFHLGTEALLFNFFGLRGGINQGYFTFGLTLNIPVMKIDFFTYGEELGDSTGVKGDRRIGIQLTFGW